MKIGTLCVVGLVLTALLIPAKSAWAMRCSEWTRVAVAEQPDVLHQLIRDELYSKANAKYQVNRAALERCLVRLVPEMQGDFDYACSEGKKASMDVLDQVLKRYISRCI